MKKFCDLKIDDTIYRCNFVNNTIEKFKIVSIEKSSYDNQLLVTVQKTNLNVYEYKNQPISINVFPENTYEHNRITIGYDRFIYWCADKEILKFLYKDYKDYILNKLKNMSKLIDEYEEIN